MNLIKLIISETVYLEIILFKTQHHCYCIFTFPSIMYRSVLAGSIDVYNRLGQYDYKGSDNFDDLVEFTGYEINGARYAYIGQERSPGSNIRDGLGICVRDNGETL